VVIHGVRIAAGCLVGAGAVVTKDLTEPGTYVGTPAKRLR
jgi:UDP-perosamine 4-acetyltransferase